MNVIPPITITDALLTGTTVVETAPAAYAGGTTYAANDTASVAGAAGLLTVYQSLQNGNIGHTPASSPTWWVNIGDTYQVYSGAATYALGDRVINATAHLVYESLIAGNTGQALTDTTKWRLIGPTNRWAMFDLLRDTKTIVPTSLTVVLTPGARCNSVALMHLVANSAVISITSDGVPVYSRTIDLDQRRIFNWYDYFFETFSTRENAACFDLPPFVNAVITITLSAATGNVELGACCIGTYVFLGTVQASAESDVLNFSTVERDFAGGTSVIVQKRNVPKTIQQIMVDKFRVNAIAEFREHTGATPMVWAALDDDTDGYFYALLVLGFYKRFTINAALPEYATISLELEEI